MSNYIEYNDKIAFHPGYYIQSIKFFDRRNPLWLCRGEEPIIRWVMRNKCMLRVIITP